MKVGRDELALTSVRIAYPILNYLPATRGHHVQTPKTSSENAIICSNGRVVGPAIAHSSPCVGENKMDTTS
jgi:hypothetical protein